MDIITIKSALVSGVIMGVLAIALGILQAGTIFGLDWHILVNAGVLGFLTSVTSVLKTVGTTTAGHFLGAVKIK